MEQNLENTVALLARTPSALSALLRDLPDGWIFTNEGDGTWTVYDVIGHLVHTERGNWLPRAQLILNSGESKAFQPLDRWAAARGGRSAPLSQLLDDFAGLRSKNLEEIRAWNLQPDDLNRRGIHPNLGPVTLSELLSTWAAHDITHLHQISRILAHQYRAAVGPFCRFLGVMHCSGHGAEA